MFSRKMGYQLPPSEYYQLWRFKSRCVAGTWPDDPQRA
jgi:hypothetical protein